MKDHPGDFSNKVGDDLYLNPWWGLNFIAPQAKELVRCMTDFIGEPELVFGVVNYNLLWRLPNKVFGPLFNVALSGPQNKMYFHFILPWRLAPLSPHSLDFEISLNKDLPGLLEYADNVPAAKKAALLNVFRE